MKYTFFKYTVLKYRPSFFLDERVNIGALFFFLDTKEVRFIYPKNLDRLSFLFPNTNLKIIQSSLKYFHKQAEKLSQSWKNETDLERLVEEHFLVKEANSLFFSDFKMGTYRNMETILNRYQVEYFKVYDTSKSFSRTQNRYTYFT